MNGIEYKSFVIHDNTLIDRVDQFFQEFDNLQSDEFQDLFDAQQEEIDSDKLRQSLKHIPFDEIESKIQQDYNLDHIWKFATSSYIQWLDSDLENALQMLKNETITMLVFVNLVKPHFIWSSERRHSYADRLQRMRVSFVYLLKRYMFRTLIWNVTIQAYGWSHTWYIPKVFARDQNLVTLGSL